MATIRKNRYAAIIEKIFFSKYSEGDEELTFEREDLVRAAKSLRIILPKNLGDVIYSIRYRTDLPRRILFRYGMNIPSHGIRLFVGGSGLSYLGREG